jgi:hypothetical protein
MLDPNVAAAERFNLEVECQQLRAELAALQAQLDEANAVIAGLMEHHMRFVIEMGEDSKWISRNPHDESRNGWIRGYEMTAQRVIGEARQQHREQSAKEQA